MPYVEKEGEPLFIPHNLLDNYLKAGWRRI